MYNINIKNQKSKIKIKKGLKGLKKIMSGHSKFANIKHRKEKNDAKKGKVFTIIGREIAVAVKSGGSDPSINSKLRDVIAKAKSNNMPNDTIERSIKKASGNIDGISYESITYEGYGIKGIAIIVETLTDNKNRTASNVRNAFTKGGGNMGTTGCVNFMFDELGQILISKEENLELDINIDGEELMLLAIEAGATDFLEDEDMYIINTEPTNMYEVLNILEKRTNIKIGDSEAGLFPQTYVKLDAPDDIKKMDKLLGLLEEDDDVKNVYHNLELN